MMPIHTPSFSIGFFVLAVLAASVSAVPAAGLVPDQLTCEYLTNPVGIDARQPRLNWVLQSASPATRGQRQTAYQVLVASRPERLEPGQADLWDTGRVESDQSFHVVYAGQALSSYQRCWWKVRVWDEAGEASPWSAPASWSMGILEPNAWMAKWIGYTKPYPPQEAEGTAQTGPSPVFRKTFTLTKPVAAATIHITGLGYFELHLNGRKVGDHVLDPGYTRYDKRVLYVTHDVAGQLRPGRNAVGVMLGNGWYNMHTKCVWDFNQAPWRAEPRMLAQLRVVYADGTVETIASDGSWRAATGPLVHDSIRNGEWYDARREQPGWDTPDFDGAQWGGAQVVDAPKGLLRAQQSPPIRVTETLTPVKLTEPKPGVFVFDLGQNIAGWAQLQVTGPAGTAITLRYGERLADDGTVTQKPIDAYVKQGRFQTDVYVLRGQGQETWEPRFTYHGFRYVEVTGWPGQPTAESLRGRVVHNDFASAGEFACSHELLNLIQRCTRWSYRGNFVSIPTDCPHREKNGWTGDAHLAAEQAMYNFANTAGYEKWLNDLYDEQQPDGNLPGIVPTSGWGYKWGNGPAWDSAYVLIPWYLYLYRGDQRVLEQHYDRLKLYVDYMTGKAKDHLVEHGLGDWVPAKTQTPVMVTSSGYYFVDATIVAQIARLLGKAEDADKYATLARNIRQAYNQTLYKGDGLYANGSQTALSCALYQGLAEPAEQARVLAQLVANVEAHDGHLDTGILGAKYLLHALTDGGRADVAYRIAIQTTAPSYGDWLQRGATTLWEDWGDGASRNHIMFGDISAWFYQDLAGIRIDPEQPAFKHIVIRPRPVGDLTWVKGEHESPYGLIRSAWQRDGQRFQLAVTIPPNTTATIHVPAQRAEQITEDGQPVGTVASLRLRAVRDGDAVFDVGSGEYRFVVQ